MKPLVTWLKVKRAAVNEVALVEQVQNKVRLKGEQLKKQLMPDYGPTDTA